VWYCLIIARAREICDEVLPSKKSENNKQTFSPPKMNVSGSEREKQINYRARIIDACSFR